jgi:large subunit ribosomal protein L7/L12
MAEKLTNAQIIDTLKQMSVLELNALVKEVEKEFGVTAAAPVAALLLRLKKDRQEGPV